MKNTEALIDDGGDIAVGAIGPIACGATAAHGHDAPAMLVRFEGETLNALLERLDTATGRYHHTGELTDEIHPPGD